MLAGWACFVMWMGLMLMVSDMLGCLQIPSKKLGLKQTARCIHESNAFLSIANTPNLFSGYATTNAKYIILVEDAIAPDDIQIQKTRENELKILLVSYLYS